MKPMLAFAVMVAASAGASARQPAAPPASPTLGPGYLESSAAPDTGFSPAPPAPGSGAEARDLEASRAGLALEGSARWALARSDAELFGASGTAALSCAAGVAIGPRSTPGLDRLLRKSAADLGLSTRAIKLRYKRARPFMVNGQRTCTPEAEAMLREDGSYPSGHSAIGYGWGLILAELVPARAPALVARGRAFGDSRRVCNVHWLSDVEEGRVAAALVVARLHAQAAFQADLKAASSELGRARAAPAGCAEQAAALALTP